jgi:hypothetical protein
MRRRASILGTIYALMRRRFAALRYFIPLPVDGFLAAIVRSLCLKDGIEHATERSGGRPANRICFARGSSFWWDRKRRSLSRCAALAEAGGEAAFLTFTRSGEI